MKLNRWLVGAAFAATMAGTMATPAAAQDSIYMPLLTYRTGAFAGSGIPIADGMRDYLEMINQRDGGVNGVKLVIDECETGYDTKKGVECYEAVKAKNPVIVNPYSTGITLQLIPRAAVDKIVVLSMAYGLSPSADGNNFPWIFNPPLTYWDGASVMVAWMAQKEGGFDKLKGKKLGLIHLDAPFGKEPIPVLENLAKKYGFELQLYPIAAADMQNQGATWLNIRRNRPDYLYNQGWGAMNPTAVKEAVRNGFPIDRLVGVWWAGGDDDARAGEAGAKGYKALSFTMAGQNFPVIQDILTHVHARACRRSRAGSHRRRDLQPRRLQLDADGRGDPQRPEADGQEGRERRGRAPRHGVAQHHRGAPQGDGHGRLRGPGPAVLRRSQRPQQGVRLRVGRDQVREGLRLDLAAQG